jgi:Tol biopolymer transport system component
VVAIKIHSLDDAEDREVQRMAPRENVTSLAWTPDGNRVVYTRERSDRAEAWSTDVASGQSVKLKFPQSRIRDLALHPDGRQIAFRVGGQEGVDLWVMEGLLAKSNLQRARVTNLK